MTVLLAEPKRRKRDPRDAHEVELMTADGERKEAKDQPCARCREALADVLSVLCPGCQKELSCERCGGGGFIRPAPKNRRRYSRQKPARACSACVGLGYVWAGPDDGDDTGREAAAEDRESVRRFGAVLRGEEPSS